VFTDRVPYLFGLNASNTGPFDHSRDALPPRSSLVQSRSRPRSELTVLRQDFCRALDPGMPYVASLLSAPCLECSELAVTIDTSAVLCACAACPA
jgi:hypothetical protein